MPKIESTHVNFEEKIPLPETNPYLIQTGIEDKARAAAMNSIFDTYSLEFFPFREIKSSAKLSFPGCGNGILIVEIAKKLQQLGMEKLQIVAFDQSKDQLKCAADYANLQGITHISWEEHDVNHLQAFENQKFTLILSRHLLNHLPQAEQVTKNLCQLLEHDGVLICEEFSGLKVSILSNSTKYKTAVDKWEECVHEQHRQQKSDLSFARHLPSLLEKTRMSVEKIWHVQPKVVGKIQKNLFPESIESLKAITALATPELKASLKEMSEDEECTLKFSHFDQILARKF